MYAVRAEVPIERRVDGFEGSQEGDTEAGQGARETDKRSKRGSIIACPRLQSFFRPRNSPALQQRQLSG